MARSMWSGAISFGLVNVPVKLYSAVSRKTVRFHQLNADTGPSDLAEAGRLGHRRRGPLREARQGLRADQGPLRRDHARGARLGLAREDPRDRHRGLRRPRGHRPDLLRPPVLPRPGQGRGEGLRAAARGDARVRQGGDRPRRDPLQGAARRDPPRGRRRADDGDDDLPRRGRPHRRPRGRAGRQGPQDHRPRAQDGAAADRLADLGLRALEVPRRVPREGARAGRAQGRGRGDRDPAAGGGADQGPRPDGRARGQPRRRQGPRRRRWQVQRQEGRRRRSGSKSKSKKSAPRAKAGAKK